MTPGELLLARLTPRDLCDLLDAQDLERTNARPLTSEEFTRIWARGRRWNGDFTSGPRRAYFRLKRRVEELAGFELTWASVDGRLELSFSPPGLVEALAPFREDARALLEVEEARVEGREPDVELTRAISASYKARMPFRKLLKRFRGVGERKIKMMLRVTRVPVRPGRPPRVEELAGEGRVSKALKAHDEGASMREVAEVLGCHKAAIRAFLRRHGRAPNGRGAA